MKTGNTAGNKAGETRSSQKINTQINQDYNTNTHYWSLKQYHTITNFTAISYVVFKANALI